MATFTLTHKATGKTFQAFDGRWASAVQKMQVAGLNAFMRDLLNRNDNSTMAITPREDEAGKWTMSNGQQTWGVAFTVKFVAPRQEAARTAKPAEITTDNLAHHMYDRNGALYG